MNFKLLEEKGGKGKMGLNTKLTENKKDYSNQNGITLIALVITIVVLLIVAGVGIDIALRDEGIIGKAQETQNMIDQERENHQGDKKELDDWLDERLGKSIRISKIIGKVVNKNTRAKDAYGNIITIPKGFKVLPHGTEGGDATYTYSGDNIPAVQDGIVIENGTDKNQFVWVPVGTINNKDNTTNTITLGRYQFDSKTGALTSTTPVQVASVENRTQEVVIDNRYTELSTFREGNTAEDSTAENATARNIAEFITTTLANGGYYIARYETTGTSTKITSRYNQSILTNVTQPRIAALAREMYGDTAEYASDLANSYAWDTAIIFIQTYSGNPNYASQNKCVSFTKAGISNDKYCNIWDMSGNAMEWTTEYADFAFPTTGLYAPCVMRGGYSNFDNPVSETSNRSEGRSTYSTSRYTSRSIIYVK